MTVRRSSLICGAVVLGLALLQSVLLDTIAIAAVTPDLVLLALVYTAGRNGAMYGQTVGFLAGIAEDFASLAPLGFHALLRLVIGFLTGLTRNKVFLDPIFVPIILIASATLLKWMVAALIAGVFSIDPAAASLFSRRFFIELGYNAVLAPPVFAVLGAILPKSERGSRS